MSNKVYRYYSGEDLVHVSNNVMSFADHAKEMPEITNISIETVESKNKALFIAQFENAIYDPIIDFDSGETSVYVFLSKKETPDSKRKALKKMLSKIQNAINDLENGKE